MSKNKKIEINIFWLESINLTTIWYPRPGLPYEAIWSFFDDFAQQPVCPLGPNKFEILRSSKVSMNKSLQAEYNRQKIFHNFFIQTMLNRKSNNTTMNTFILLTNMIFICNILQNCINFYCFVMAILPYHYVIPYEISLPSHTLYYSGTILHKTKCWLIEVRIDILNDLFIFSCFY